VKHIFIALIAVLGCAVMSCGPVHYSVHVIRASAALAEAEESNAAEMAPYEFYYADEHMKQARREVGYSDFQAAAKCAKIATEYGNKATSISNRRRQEEGR